MRYHNSETAHKGGCQRKLSRYQEFILTLMRLRLNLLTFFLVDVFGTSQSRVSQIYATWINFMHNVFSPLIRTPSRKQLRKHVPQSFKEIFPNTITIIDCTDIIVETQEHQQLSHSYIARIKAGILTKLQLRLLLMGHSASSLIYGEATHQTDTLPKNVGFWILSVLAMKLWLIEVSLSETCYQKEEQLWLCRLLQGNVHGEKENASLITKSKQQKHCKTQNPC